MRRGRQGADPHEAPSVWQGSVNALGCRGSTSKMVPRLCDRMALRCALEVRPAVGRIRSWLRVKGGGGRRCVMQGRRHPGTETGWSDTPGAAAGEAGSCISLSARAPATITICSWLGSCS